MKRLFTILTTMLLAATCWAQSSQKMSYQAVIRDASKHLVTNQQLGMQISILQGSTDGAAIYTETLTPTSNANGLVSIEIGGDAGFEGIDWASDLFFLKTEIDPAGGTDYTITGISQLLSVPYALHAKTAESITDPVAESDPVYAAWDKNYMDLSHTPAIVDTVDAVLDTCTRFIRQELDGDVSNELQDLTYTGNSLSIENGNSVTINQSRWTTLGNHLVFNDGLVGIGIASSPLASLDVYDAVGYPFFRFVSEDNVYTQWISDRLGVDDYQVGIDGGNNRFMFANTTVGNFPLVLEGEHIGINQFDPEASLHINDFMKLEPRSTAPSPPTEGMVYYDGSTHKLRVYNGSIWEDLH